jgi:CrcB protein
MNVSPSYLVGIGGIVGAVLRHLVGLAVSDERLPLGTLTVNIIGSFALGLFTFLSLGDDILLLLGTGACGSFTTFSSFAVDTVELWEDTRPWVAAGYAAANIVGALLAISIAYVLTL